MFSRPAREYVAFLEERSEELEAVKAELAEERLKNAVLSERLDNQSDFLTGTRKHHLVKQHGSVA